MAYHGEEYNRLINCTKWRRIRDYYIGGHPLCEQCLKIGIYTPATVVHHITPVEDARSKTEMAGLAYNPSNLMSLCQPCHLAIHTTMGQKTNAKLLERKEQRAARAFEHLFGTEPEKE